MSKHSHNELGNFVFDIDQFSVCQTEDGLDEVWDKIIGDVHKYEERERYEWYDEDAPAVNFSLEQPNRPDIVYQCDDFIMGIECFEFDASKKTRKGSKQKQKEAEADRAIYDEYLHSTIPEGSFLSVERPVDVELSITSYFESLVSSFRNHADSIVDYRRNLANKAPGKKVLLSFYVEDKTAIGNYAVVNGKQEALDPLKIPAFLDIIASTQGLDYVLIKTTCLYVPSIRIQQISVPAMKKLANNCYGPNDKYVRYQYKRQTHFWR